METGPRLKGSSDCETGEAWDPASVKCIHKKHILLFKQSCYGRQNESFENKDIYFLNYFVC